MPNQDINLSTYDPNAAAIQRQQRLAELLQQQANAPIDINSGGGVQAPINPLAVLAKGFSGYAGSYLDKKAQEKAAVLQLGYRKDLASQLANFYQKPAQAGDTGYAPQTIDATAPTLPGAEAPQQRGAMMPGQPQMAPTGPTQTTSQEQLANALQMMASGNPYSAQIAPQLYAAALNRGNLDYSHQLGRQDKQWENAQPMSTAAGQQIAAQGAQAQSNAQFQNTLPQTANERATTNLGYAQLNKPQAVPFGAQMYDPRTRQMITPAGTGPAPAPIDPKSNSLLAQTGLSQAAFEYLTSGKLPRGQALAKAAQDEAGAFSRTHGVDTSTMQSQFKANNNTLQSNITRNNQAKVLEGEIGGTVNSIIPLANAIGQGQINAAGIANVWAGKEVNDPNVMKYRDQLLRLRSEIAGFNAVAAGKLTEHGQPRVDDGDLREAEQLISSGMNAGGAAGLAQSIQMTAHKNATVLNSAIDDANQSVWSQFGVGKNYKRNSPVGGGGNGGGNIPPPPAGFQVHP